MIELQSLSPIHYKDQDKKIALQGYADTLVYQKHKNERTLVAMHFGGYPEHVRGLSDAIGSGIKFEADIQDHTVILTSLQKQYRKTLSHDGVYAEAALFALDDSINDEDEDEQQVSAETQKRNMYIFCKPGDKQSLFEEIDKKTSVPMIPAFSDFLLSELENSNALIPLEVLSASAQFDAYLLQVRQDEKEIVDIINRGIHDGTIQIPNAVSGNGNFQRITGVSQYLKEYGVSIANRIKGSFTPLFDPETDTICDNLKKINGYLYKNVHYSLYPAQLAVAEATKRRLDQAKMALIVAECGSGKTKIGASALVAHQKKKSLNVILSPSHVTKKWVREIEETLPDTKAVIVRSTSDVDRVVSDFKTGNKTICMVMSKERARDGYMKKPAVRFSESKRAFVCPDCGGIVEMTITEDGSSYRVKADQFFFQRQNDKNHKCEHCGSNLWTAINPSNRAQISNEWVKIGNYGFVFRPFAAQHYEKSKNIKISAQIADIANNPSGYFPAVGAYRRYPISAYIKKKIKRIDGLILDELHLFKGDSGQGAAMAELVGVSKKVIGMTATLINGYSSGIFYLLFRIAPHLMLLDGKSYNNPAAFNTEYGVTESVYELKEAQYNANSRNKKKKIRERQLPGVSPLVYSRFLIESAAFLSLNDMGKHLPDYEEIPIMLEMNDQVREEYNRLESELKRVIRNEKKVAKRILSRYLGLLSLYPDQPYGQEPIYFPGSKDTIVEPEDTSDFDELHEKDVAVLDIVERKVNNGERVLIYTNWVKIDTQNKLAKLLTEKGYRVEVLKANIAPEKREEWVENKVEKGLDVLITNPSLVETGLDLNAFTTLIYYNIGYNLFTFRQSSRRSWRINQTAPKVEVYILYYAGVMQARAMKLMASKLSVATIIEGNLSDEGLAAMSDCRDMTTLLAKELTLGIKEEVEDVAELFKKMAIINTDIEDDYNQSDYMITSEEALPLEKIISHETTIVSEKPKTQMPKPVTLLVEEVAHKIDIAAAFVRKKRHKQEMAINPGQVSFFDMTA